MAAKSKRSAGSKPAATQNVATAKTSKPALAGVKAEAAPARKLPKAAATRKGDATQVAVPDGTTDTAAARGGAGVKTAGTDSKTPKRNTAPRPISLVLKVLGTINGELTKLEDHKGKSSQDRERASRALSQMVTSLEKTVDMQRQIQRDRSATSGPKDKEALRHAEEMRRDIAERLERLHRQRNASRRPESSERG